jgi:hypothetical protein
MIYIIYIIYIYICIYTHINIYIYIHIYVVRPFPSQRARFGGGLENMAPVLVNYHKAGRLSTGVNLLTVQGLLAIKDTHRPRTLQ